ncbi:imidazole glycerol phosphate synthase subunit HisH [Sediminibacterium soli]|uniref:imidazole glycerol phosphate synthase subunit HisH n=1 Tax=Sediminibacterium soli TaxID=2698829 RepID=UPI00137A05BE|nr:imidazole glycerol phosphate synthase subunit HisH [Sediminibacterium soli]NCI48073.1 imidazole glycerol phosphate synthase subunit HisH [Sediminibacterium soli]
MTCIINYGSGNVRAIGNIYDRLKVPYSIVARPSELLAAERIILPGVGAFDQTMDMLNKSGFREVLERRVIQENIPVLGICVGMQILAEGSEEGVLDGLGWIKGRVQKFDKETIAHKPKIPHLGWNSICAAKTSNLFNGIDQAQGFYFIHSYYFKCTHEQDILATTHYGNDFSSAVNRDNIYGVQFHPEKSHHNGISLLENFVSI